MIGVTVLGVFDPQATEKNQAVNPFYGEFLFRFEREPRQQGYTIAVYAGREESAINFLLERNVDVALILGAIAQDLPVVLKRRDIRLLLFDSFVPDDGFLTPFGYRAAMFGLCWWNYSRLSQQYSGDSLSGGQNRMRRCGGGAWAN